MDLNESDLKRFARHLVLPGFGIDAQKKLKKSKVLVVGAGGLGSPVLMYLAAAGIGTLGLVEYDSISISNLQRQILYNVEDENKNKGEVAELKIKKINPDLIFLVWNEKLNSKNALGIFEQFDVIVDCSDNFPSRYLVNDACEILDKPFVFAAIHQYEGQLAVYNLNGSATYRDHFPSSPNPQDAPDCTTGGVLGPVAGIMGCWQALEAIKIIALPAAINRNELMLFNFWGNHTKKVKIPRDPKRPKVTELIDYERFCGLLDSKYVLNEAQYEHFRSSYTQYTLIDVREPSEYEEDFRGGVNITLPEIKIDQNILSKYPAPYVFFCASAKRSKAVVDYLYSLDEKREYFYLNFRP